MSVSFDRVPPVWTQNRFNSFLNDVETWINSGSAPANFVYPFSYIIKEVSTGVYSAYNSQGVLVYGGANDLGTVNGEDVDAVIAAALQNLTSGRTWKERVILEGSFTISLPIEMCSYTILDIYGKITAANDFPTNTGMIRNVTTEGAVTYLEVNCGLIDGNKTGVSGTYGTYGLTFGRQGSTDSADNVIIKNVVATNCKSHGIGIRPYTTNCWIENCVGSNCGLNGIDIMSDTESEETTTYNVWVTNCKTTGNARNGIDVSAVTSKVWVTNPTVTGNCTLNTVNDAGIVLSSDGDDVYVDNPIVYDNGVGTSPATFGIRLSGTGYKKVSGGRIFSSDTQLGAVGLRVFAGATNSEVDGVKIQNMPNGIQLYYFGGEGVTNCKVSNCKIDSVATGIKLFGSQNCTVVNNVLSNCSVDGIIESDALGGTTDYNLYAANQLSDTVTDPLTIVGSNSKDYGYLPYVSPGYHFHVDANIVELIDEASGYYIFRYYVASNRLVFAQGSAEYNGLDFVNAIAGRGLIVKTPDGAHTYRISVNNSGTVISTLVS